MARDYLAILAPSFRAFVFWFRKDKSCARGCFLAHCQRWKWGKTMNAIESNKLVFSWNEWIDTAKINILLKELKMQNRWFINTNATKKELMKPLQDQQNWLLNYKPHSPETKLLDIDTNLQQVLWHLQTKLLLEKYIHKYVGIVLGYCPTAPCPIHNACVNLD